MKKVLSILLVLCFSLTVIFAVDIATVKWALKTPRSINYIRYQVNDELDDAWTVVENDESGIVLIEVESPTDISSTLYVQQSIDGVIWSKSASKTISAEVVQSVYNKTHMKEVVVRVPSVNYDMDINSAFTSDDMTTDITELEKQQYLQSVGEESESGLKFTFLFKPSAAINLQKAIALNDPDKNYWENRWQSHKLKIEDIAPRLDIGFMFENIAGKKHDVVGFDMGFTLGYETRPYSGWKAQDETKKAFDPSTWYHKANIDLRLGMGLNLANNLVRPYFGVGAGAEFLFTNLPLDGANSNEKIFDFAVFNSKNFVLKNGKGNSLSVMVYPYILGTLGVRFTFGQFTFGLEGTYKVYLVGTKPEDMWHKIDAGITLGGTFSI